MAHLVSTEGICPDDRWNWWGLAALGEKVYGAPCHAHSILELDTETGGVRGISTEHVHEGPWKWRDPVVCLGRVYFTPWDAPCILELDPATDSLRAICTEDVHSGKDKWSSAAVINDAVFFAPSSAPGVLKYDPSTDGLHLFSTDYIHSGAWKWESACVAQGRLYLSPWDAPCILELEPAAMSVRPISTVSFWQGEDKWFGCVALAGKVYFLPHSADQILELDPSTQTLRGISTEDFHSGPCKWRSALGALDRVWMLPWDACCALAFDPCSGELKRVPQTPQIHTSEACLGACELRGRIYTLRSDGVLALDIASVFGSTARMATPSRDRPCQRAVPGPAQAKSADSPSRSLSQGSAEAAEAEAAADKRRADAQAAEAEAKALHAKALAAEEQAAAKRGRAEAAQATAQAKQEEALAAEAAARVKRAEADAAAAAFLAERQEAEAAEAAAQADKEAAHAADAVARGKQDELRVRQEDEEAMRQRHAAVEAEARAKRAEEDAAKQIAEAEARARRAEAEAEARVKQAEVQDAAVLEAQRLAAWTMMSWLAPCGSQAASLIQSLPATDPRHTLLTRLVYDTCAGHRHSVSCQSFYPPPRLEVKDVSLVHNPRLVKLYLAQVEQIEDLRKTSGCADLPAFANLLLPLHDGFGRKNLNEHLLFHGAASPVLNEVCQRGFDPRLYDESAGRMFGAGTYFAASASQADVYTEDFTARLPRRAERKLIVARVLLGAAFRATAPLPQAVRPPNGEDGRPLDSVWADVQANGGAVDHLEAVVYSPGQAIPVAVVTYAHAEGCPCSECRKRPAA